MKYRTEFPDEFESLAVVRSFCTDFYGWYNHEHRHSGIGMHTPFNLHHGRAPAIHHARGCILTIAYDSHPERFVLYHPLPPTFPTASWINGPEKEGMNSMTG
ncbi:integrase core domain-containing protein [Cryobacterium sp. Y50]|uniref:integrase core domain-containing protein n=1 Tax=Cryobacterium sp. Y50 TaxID=2048286 RepID=UPI001304E935|nr:integrase core domain-containing protein [Cryobacterium sp. Y50]